MPASYCEGEKGKKGGPYALVSSSPGELEVFWLINYSAINSIKEYVIGAGNTKNE